MYPKNPSPKNEHLGINEDTMYLEIEWTCLCLMLYFLSMKEYAHEGEDDSEDESEGDKDEVKADEE